MHGRSTFPSVLLFALLAGCTVPYVPSVIAVDETKTGSVALHEPVRLVNAQAASDPLAFGGQAGTTFTADLHAWTETAVVEMRQALAKHGMPETGDATKELRLSVTRVNAIFGFAVIRAIITLRVETGDGQTREVEGNAGSGWTLYRACDAAVARAVAAALADATIAEYLERPAVPGGASI
jgi:hypothetical protein